MPQLLHFTIFVQDLLDCCFKGRWWVMPRVSERQRQLLNTLRRGYVTSKEIISSNLFFLLPAFSFLSATV